MHLRRTLTVLVALTVLGGATGCSSSLAPVQAAPTVVHREAKDPTPVHQWKFDDGSGASAADSVRKLGVSMELQGGAAWVPGVAGTAVSLNGNGQEADATLQTFDTRSYSVSAWVRLSRIGDAYQTVVSEDPGRGDSSAFFLQYAEAPHAFAFSFADARAIASGVTPRPNTWYHLVGVRDAATETLSIYVDGRLGGTAGAPTDPSAGSGTLVVGRGYSGGAAGDYVGGAIDNVAVYTKALTARQVAALYNESAPR